MDATNSPTNQQEVKALAFSDVLLILLLVVCVLYVLPCILWRRLRRSVSQQPAAGTHTSSTQQAGKAE